MATLDLTAFAARAARPQKLDPARAARAGLALVDGALRIRRGGDGIYGVVERPITKPAEAVGAWLRSMEQEILGGDFQRPAELREAVVAAGEEVDAAARVFPRAEGLRHALYTDALGALGAPETSPRNFLPWLVASALGGALLALLFTSQISRPSRRR